MGKKPIKKPAKKEPKAVLVKKPIPLEKATPEVKIAEISKEIVRVQGQAKNLQVATQTDYEAASKFLSDIVKPRLLRVQAVMDFFIKPHQEARKKALEEMKKIEGLFAPQLTALTDTEKKVKTAMGGYLRVQEEAARKEEERLAKLREKQDERRENKGLAPIATPLPTVERPETLMKSENGGKTVAKKVWKFEITDPELLYKDKGFMLELYALAATKGLHEQVLRKMVNAGTREIAGVKIYEDFDINTNAAKW